MRKLNDAATEILEILTDNGQARYKKIDNTARGFMPVVIENLGTYYTGTLFSVAHYWQQNGDLMRDPEMTFIRSKDGRYFPASFRQDPFVHQESIFYDPEEDLLRVNPTQQARHATFAEQWLANIQQQQHL